MKASIFPDKYLKEEAWGEVQSLQNLCIDELLLNHKTTKKILPHIPKDLFEDFLVLALINEQRDCIKEIVAQWPYRELTLRKLMPHLREKECRACSWDYMSYGNDWQALCPRSAYVKKLCLMVIAGFQEQIKCNGNLKVLDISRIDPTLGGKFVTDVLKLFRRSKSKDNNTMQKSGEPRVLYMDWHVDQLNEDRILRFLGSPPPNNVSIKCHSLSHGSSCRDRSVTPVLTTVDPQDIINLNLWILRSDLWDSAIKALEPLVNLVSLEFSLGIKLRSPNPDDDIYSKLGNVFGKLSSLQELDLMSNTLTGELHTVLGQIKNPLIKLVLYSCGLNEADMTYLVNYHHAKQLKHLSIGGNDFSKHPENLFKLLTLSSDTLVDCSLAKASLGDIESVTSKMIQLGRGMQVLQYLDLASNALSVADLAEIVMAYAINVPTLKIVYIPLVITYEEEEFDDDHGMIVEPELPMWDDIDFGDPNLDRFLQICVKGFHCDQIARGRNELHVVMKGRSHGSSECSNRCFTFQF